MSRDETKGIWNAPTFSQVPMSLLVIMMITGCSSVPPTTQTGEVRDVHIESAVAPEIIHARAGDEIRWINHRKGSVTLTLLDTREERISCNKGFSKEGTAVIGSNQTASICFNKAGEVKYNVRMESLLPGGEEPAKGQIEVR